MFAVKECGPQQMCVEGILNVAKPSGWTSHDVVAKLRGALKNIRVGHAGTLDPAATGVLPILLGRGTRIAEYLLEWDKGIAPFYVWAKRPIRWMRPGQC